MPQPSDMHQGLAEVQAFMSASPWASAILSIVMKDPETDRPFLVALALKPDRFLRDQAATRLRVLLDHQGLFVASLHTYNREVYKESILRDLSADLAPLLDELCGDHLLACVGFSEAGQDELFSRKMLPRLLVQKYDGIVLLRARNCAFVLDRRIKTEEKRESVGSSTLCAECSRLISDLDAQLGREGSSVTEGQADVPEKGESYNELLTRTTRKGYKQPEIAYHSIIKMEMRDDEEQKIGDRADHASMEDDHTKEDIGLTPRKSLRKRKPVRKLSILPRKLKRGRPPTLTGPASCETCGKIFAIAKDYKKHRLEHTHHICCNIEDCIKRFKSQEDMNTHLKSHRGENPYLCFQCGATFSCKRELKTHQRNHAGDKPYLCKACGKTFARKSGLRIHNTSVHESVKSFLCSECGAAFKSNSALIDHRKRVHLQVKPHCCEHCGKDFFSKKDYAEHVRTHTGEKPFQCQLCGKCFGRQNHLKRHVHGVHKLVKGIQGQKREIVQ